MPGFMRSSSVTLWLTVLIWYDVLLHVVHAATIEANSAYQACLASVSTCTELCASLPP